MNFLYKSLILCFCFGLFFSACNKESVDEVVVLEEPIFETDTIEVNNLIIALQSNTSDGLNLGCITVIFPFDLLLESGNMITIDSEEAFVDAMNAEAPNRVVDFVYPLIVTDQDGNESEVTSNEELGASFASCIPSDGWDDIEDDEDLLPAFLFDNEGLCFELVYPVTLIDIAGNSYTVETEAEFIDLMATNELLFFTFPLTLSAEVDGTVSEIEVMDEADFYELLFDCEAFDPPYDEDEIEYDTDGFACFDFVFPFNVIIEGEIVTVNDENDYAELLLTTSHIEFAYPLTLTNEAGETFTYNSLEELFFGLVEECEIGIDIGPTDPCSTPAHVLLYFNQGLAEWQCGYIVDFPTQITAEGVTYDIANMEEYFEVYNNYAFMVDAIDIIYPVSVTQYGSTIEFDNDEEVCAFIQECE